MRVDCLPFLNFNSSQNEAILYHVEASCVEVYKRLVELYIQYDTRMAGVLLIVKVKAVAEISCASMRLPSEKPASQDPTLQKINMSA